MCYYFRTFPSIQIQNSFWKKAKRKTKMMLILSTILWVNDDFLISSLIFWPFSRIFLYRRRFFTVSRIFSAQLEFETVQTLMAHLSDTECILEESWANSVDTTDSYSYIRRKRINQKKGYWAQCHFGWARIGCRLFDSNNPWPLPSPYYHCIPNLS